MKKYAIPLLALCCCSCSILYPQKKYADFRMGGSYLMPKNVKFVTIEQNVSIGDKHPEFIYDNPNQFLSPLNIDSASLTHRNKGRDAKFTIEFIDLSDGKVIGKRNVHWVESSCILGDKIFYRGNQNKLYNRFSVRILPQDKHLGEFRFYASYMIANGKHTWAR